MKNSMKQVQVDRTVHKQKKQSIFGRIISIFYGQQQGVHNDTVTLPTLQSKHEGKEEAIDMDNLIKIGEAQKLLKTSAPTVRKYARLGYYREYRFGEKLVFYDKAGILSFILNGASSK